MQEACLPPIFIVYERYPMGASRLMRDADRNDVRISIASRNLKDMTITQGDADGIPRHGPLDSPCYCLLTKAIEPLQ